MQKHKLLLRATRALAVAVFALVGSTSAHAYNRGSSPVVGGFSGSVTYYGVNNVQGGCCGCWARNGNTYNSVTTLYGTVSYSNVNAYVRTTNASACDPGSGTQYLSMKLNVACPANTAPIKVKDYLRADGVVMPGVSTICVATDTY